MDASIEHAARSLDASALTAFRRVRLPLALPGIVNGWLMAFIKSYDETTMTVFLSSTSMTTLLVRLYLHIEDSIDPLVAAVSVVLIVLALGLMVFLDRCFGLERVLAGEGMKGETR